MRIIHSDVFLDPTLPYLPDVTPVQRRAAAVSDFLNGIGDCQAGQKPPNFGKASVVLCDAIGDAKLTECGAKGDANGLVARLYELSDIVIAELNDESAPGVGPRV